MTYDRYVFAEQESNIKFVMENLDDEFSRETYQTIIKARYDNDYSQLCNVCVPNQYFAIPQVRAVYGIKESYVDVGAYVGDTLEKYIFDRMEIFDKIYAFEPGRKQYEALLIRCERLKREWALDDDKIICENIALTNRTCKVGLKAGGSSLGSNYIVHSSRENNVDACSLDEYLEGKSVGFIKADIEGEELRFLEGAENTIKVHKPRLAICLYHNPYDFVTIPLLIKGLRNDYNMAVRHHTLEYNETVLYCW